MASNIDSETKLQSGFDPLIQTENIAFERSAMITCEACKRNNPPNRPACLYCGAAISLQGEIVSDIAQEFRKLESWEKGINVIFRGVSGDLRTKQAASLLSIEHDDLMKIIDAASPIPLTRVESERQAGALIESLRQYGLRCLTVSDVSLALEKPNIRISGIDISSEEFGVKDFNTGKYLRFPTYEIGLVVEGVISKTRVDSTEKRRIRGESKIVDQSTISADDRVLDIYPTGQVIGFRLIPAGFDFSCLGGRKSLLARENWGRLIDLLKAKLPSASFIHDYVRMRESLAIAWPVESRNESKGMIQSGFGKREFGNVSTTTNLEQFNRYSRLQKHLL